MWMAPRGWMVRLVLLTLCLFVAPVLAQPEDEEPLPSEAVAAPETRAGKQLDWVLRVINGEAPGEPAVRFAPRFIETGGAKDALGTMSTMRAKSFQNKPVILVRCYEAEENPDSLDGVITALGVRNFLSVFLILDDKTGLIAGLVFNISGYSSQPGDWDAFEGDSGALGGKVSFGCYELLPPAEGQMTLRMQNIYEIDERDSLSVGGAYTLWVLGALAERVDAGKAAWADVVALRDDWKCLPGGELSSKPAGTEVPLGSLALRMISFSDTTAADHLFGTVGRPAVEEYLQRFMRDPRRNLPLLSARQYFFLKLTEDAEVRDAWTSGSREERTQMLADGGAIGAKLPRWKGLNSWEQPLFLDRIGHYACVEDLCKTMADLRRLEQRPGMEPLGAALREDGGPLTLDPQRWRSIGYKGGSEPGMLSQFWLLEHASGRWFVMGLAWNHPTQLVSEDRLGALATSGIALLEKHVQEHPVVTPPVSAPGTPAGAPAGAPAAKPAAAPAEPAPAAPK